MVEMKLQGGQVSNFSESVQSRNLSLFYAQNASSLCHQLLWLSRLPLFPLKFCVVFVGSQHAKLSLMMLRKIQETSLQSTIVRCADPETRGKVCYFWFSGVRGNHDCLFVSAPVGTNRFF